MMDQTAGQTSGDADLMSHSSLLQARWEKEYQSTTTPFDIDVPDEWIAFLEKSGKIKGRVLDAGCGPGRTSFYLASQGHSVFGVDLSMHAIERAQRKAAERGSSAAFQQADMCTFNGFTQTFDTVVDIGCFHSLYDEDRPAYAANLYRMCRPGAVVYLRALSSNNLTKGNHSSGLPVPALGDAQIRTTFASCGWIVDNLSERKIELYLSEERKPSVYCWFAEIHRS